METSWRKVQLKLMMCPTQIQGHYGFNIQTLHLASNQEREKTRTQIHNHIIRQRSWELKRDELGSIWQTEARFCCIYTCHFRKVVEPTFERPSKDNPE